MSLVNNVRTTIDAFGQADLSGVKLESADARLLDVGSLDLDRHVAMQPSAIAYYGSMLKEASRRLASLKKFKDRWENKKWALAKAAVLSGSTQTYKPTLKDIEVRFIVDNEHDIEDWEKKIEDAQEEVDTLESWYEAWKQKSFALKDHVSIDNSENYNGNSSMKGGIRSEGMEGLGNNAEQLRKVRESLKARKEAM
jgi:hypothetical protein